MDNYIREISTRKPPGAKRLSEHKAGSLAPFLSLPSIKFEILDISRTYRFLLSVTEIVSFILYVDTDEYKLI
jgi:hypothetical protein